MLVPTEKKLHDPFIHIGDQVCLYCVQVQGYAFCQTTSSSENSLTIYTGQNKDKPENIIRPEHVSFRIHIENRFKLNKNLHKLREVHTEGGATEQDVRILENAEEAADAETRDNDAEQKRLQGKHIKYGDIIQFKHVLTEKYIHMNPLKTSKRDKACVQTHLLASNGKTAQFKILPKFKINSEGDYVREGDQVVIESVKYPSQFLNASAVFTHDKQLKISEMNLGAKSSSFKLVKRNNPCQAETLGGGTILQFQHKDLEAYLNAEGDQDTIKEDVHFLSCEEVTYLEHGISTRPTDISSYWQLEHEQSIIRGEAFEWNQQVRIQHLLTFHYLCIREDKVTLCKDPTDPVTVFKLHPMYDDNDSSAIVDGSFIKLEHVVSGRWIHADRGEEYIRSTEHMVQRTQTFTQVKSSEELQTQDAFCLQRMDHALLQDVNFVYGIVPLFKGVIEGIRIAEELSSSEAESIRCTLTELHVFVEKNHLRQTLLIEFKIMDLMINIIFLEGQHMHAESERLSFLIYELLHEVVSSNDEAACTYISQYLSFFQSQIHQNSTDAPHATRVVTELCKDKKQVMERIDIKFIERCTILLRKYKQHVYLELLSTLCICKGVAIPDNQKEVSDQLVNKRKGYLYRFELTADGQVCVWKRMRKEAVVLADLLKSQTQEETLFVKQQLWLFESLCHGRNQECIDAILDTGYLSVEVVTACMRSSDIAEDIRAYFCRLFISLFVNVGENTPVTDTISTAFSYDSLESRCSADTWLNYQAEVGHNTLCVHGPDVLDWLIIDLKENCLLRKNTEMKNKLVLAQITINIHGNRVSPAQSVKNLRVVFDSNFTLSDHVSHVIQSTRELYKIHPLLDLETSVLSASVLIVHDLILFGYCDVSSLKELLPVMMLLLMGEQNKVTSVRYKAMMKPARTMTPAIAHLFPGLTRKSTHIPFSAKRAKYFQDETNQTLIDVKFQAMVVLEKLMDLQRHFTLERFVGLFRQIEVSDRDGQKDRHQLADFLYTHQDNKRTWWWQSPTQSLKAAVDEIFKENPYLPDENLTAILVNLASYKDDNMTRKAMRLLHKYCNANSMLLSMAKHAQVLLTKQSLSIHEDVQNYMPVLFRLSSVKVYFYQAQSISQVLRLLTKCCMRSDNPHLPNHCAQNVLVNHGLLPLLMQILQMEEQGKKGTQNIDYETLIRDTLLLLYAMAKDNDTVKDFLFESINVLLRVKYAIKDLAEVLKELFHNNSSVCWGVEAVQVEKVFQLIIQYKGSAPNLVQVLQHLIVVKQGDGYIKRNQDLVMKIGTEKYPEFTFIFDIPKEAREKIMMGQSTVQMRAYLVHTLNLIVICSKNTKGPVQSFCQNLLTPSEVLGVMTNDSVPNNLKRPYLKYFTLIALKSQIPGQISYTMRLKGLWDFLQQCIHLAGSLMDYINFSVSGHGRLSLEKVEDDFVAVTSEELDKSNLYYFVDGVLPLLDMVSKRYTADAVQQNNEHRILSDLAVKLIEFAPVLTSTLQLEKHFELLKVVTRRVAICCSCSISAVNTALHQMDLHFKPLKVFRPCVGMNSRESMFSRSLSQHDLESVVNSKLQNFVKNCEVLYVRENTVGAQLGPKVTLSKSVVKKEYTKVGSSEALPLTIDFQTHVSAFLSKKEGTAHIDMEKFKQVTVLIKKLEIIAKRAKLGIPTEDEELEIRTLQILRAILHNNIVLIPDHVEGKRRTKLTRMTDVLQLQDFLVNHGLIPIILDLLVSKSGAIFREVLALLNCLLYDANGSVQNETIKYFKQNQDEMFFKMVLDYLKQASLLAKERRAYESQRRENQKYTKPSHEEESEKKPPWKMLRFGKSSKVGVKRNASQKKKELDEEEFEREEQRYFRDDGTIQLIFKVLAKLCDGQHQQLQDYLREQPDNLRTYNLVSAVAQYLQATFHSINRDSIDLVIQIFDTLNEICAGNQQNRTVILDGKVIDYINFILRTEMFSDCSLDTTLGLYKSIADLLISMIEESSPDAFKVAKDVANTLDVSAVANTMQKCYNFQTSLWWASLANKVHTQEMSDTAIKAAADLAKRVGYKLYIVFARINDVRSQVSVETDEGPVKEVTSTYQKLLSCGKAIEYYRNNVLSIEASKDGHLQKIYFPVANYKNLIRSEMKESLKWNIDRSSPSEKIRDFMHWSKVIMRSISYQQRIHKNIFSRFITKNSWVWHYIMILLSLTMNIMMISTWHSQVSLADVASNASSLPSAIYDPAPNVKMEQWPYVFVIMAICHNLVTLVLVVSFFLAENPIMPKMPDVASCIGQEKKEQALKDTTRDSVTHLVSVTTLYYILLMVMSLLGSFTYGYFFAFHLFDIVNVNQLLQGVIRAVTLNGRSLVYVAILGVIFLYVYALLGFALFRTLFDPTQELYCATLWQCSVTLIRYGLIGDIDEVLRRHPLENTFQNFGFLVLYQVIFFVFFTTIGLNIIFGIIVDTFSELRDLKWRAEKDMHEYCFICSLPSYELEHHGKGFYHHVTYEHNMWAYIYYFIYLANTNVNDYTALDYYVFQLLEQENNAFFPLNKALCMMHLQEEISVESQDPTVVMASEINFLVKKAKDDTLRKRQRKEKKQREKWQKKFRRQPLIMTTHVDDDHSSVHSSHAASQSVVPYSMIPQTQVPQSQVPRPVSPVSSAQGHTEPDGQHTSLYAKGPNASKSHHPRMRSRSRSRSPRRRRSPSSSSVGRTTPTAGTNDLRPETSSSVTSATQMTSDAVPRTRSNSDLGAQLKKKVMERRVRMFEEEASKRQKDTEEIGQVTVTPRRSRHSLRRHATEQQALLRDFESDTERPKTP